MRWWTVALILLGVGGCTDSNAAELVDARTSAVVDDANPSIDATNLDPVDAADPDAAGGQTDATPVDMADATVLDGGDAAHDADTTDAAVASSTDASMAASDAASTETVVVDAGFSFVRGCGLPTMQEAEASDQRGWFLIDPTTCASGGAKWVKVAPTDPRTLLGFNDLGLQVSTNGGDAWRRVEPRWDVDPMELKRYALLSGAPIVFDPFDASVLYSVLLTGASEFLLVRSNDLGYSWVDVAHTVSDVLAVDPAHRGTLYIGQNPPACQVSKSVDYGATWTQLVGKWCDLDNDKVSALKVAPTGRLYLTSDLNGLSASDDDGTTWKRLLPLAGAGVVWAPSEPSVLYAVAGEQLVMSFDSGSHWTARSLPPQGGYAQTLLSVHPTDPASMYVVLTNGFEDGQLYASSENPFRWRKLDVRSGDHVLGLAWSDDRLIVVSSGSVLGTDAHGEFWSDQSIGLGASQLGSVQYGDANTVYVDFGNALAQSVDEGASWWASTPDAGIPVASASIDPTDARQLLALGSTYTIEAHDLDVTVTRRDNANAGVALCSAWQLGLRPCELSALSVDPTDSRTRYACADDLYVTHDAATTWVKTTFGQRCTATALAPSAPTVLFAVTSGPEVRIRKSMDRGATWLSDAPTLAADSIYLRVDPNNDQVILAWVGAGDARRLLLSHDGGATFAAPAWPFEPRSLAFDKQLPSTLYATAARGVWKSIDRGQHWKAIDLGIERELPFDISVSPANSKHLFITTSGGLFASVSGGE